MAKKRAKPAALSLGKLRVCVDVFPPPDERERFAEIARGEEPSNVIAGLSQALGYGVILPVSIAVITAKKWANGRTLKVAFLGGTSKQQEFTGKTASRWSEHANIKFQWGVPAAQSDVRVAFKPTDGAWSFIGTDVLGIAKSQPTMNLGWLDDSVVLHEFGHLLGCIHEHQHPKNGIPWNRPPVYKSLAGPPNYWDKETVQHNMFDAYSVSQTQFSEYDPGSIMHYAIPAEWLTDASKAVGWNTDLSASDTKFMSELYPKTVQPPPGRGARTLVIDWAKKSLALDGKEV